MLRFKSLKLEDEFTQLDKRLQVITYAVAGFIAYKFNKDVIVTSVLRNSNKLSVHYWKRGIDTRVTPKEGAPIYTEEELEEIKIFCTRFLYSAEPKKRKFKTLKIHDTGSGLHLHLQVDGSNYTRILR